MLDGEEIDIMPTFWINRFFDEIGLPVNFDAYIFAIYSNPTKKDSDGDGIIDYYMDYNYNDNDSTFDKDNRPLVKGVYSSIADDIIIGELTIVSCSNNITGHAFLVYRSFVKDKLDFTELTYGYEYMTWKGMEPCEYRIGRLEYVAIGNAGAGVGGSSSKPSESGSSGSNSSSSDSDRAGVFFNREFAVEMNSEDSAYDENKAYSRLISEKQLEKVIKHCVDYNYYNLINNNCAIVAAGAWNAAFDSEEFDVVFYPPALKKQIGKLDGSFVFDIYEVLGE